MGDKNQVKKKGTPSKSCPAVASPSLPKMEEAVRSFLEGLGVQCDEYFDLAHTPQTVARAWAEEFLQGYQTSPHSILASRLPLCSSQSDLGLVVFSQLAFQSVCPHHLLPYGGIAHVSYLPAGEVVGFGQIVDLVNCLSRRLVLQEDLAQNIANALVENLGATAAGVVLSAHPSCVTLRGTRNQGIKTVVEAWAGSMNTDHDLRARFLSAIQSNCKS